MVIFRGCVCLADVIATISRYRMVDIDIALGVMTMQFFVCVSLSIDAANVCNSLEANATFRTL